MAFPDAHDVATFPQGWRITGAPPGRMMVQITQLLRRAVQTRADGTAAEHDGRKRTWAEFEARVTALAGAMADLGFRPGDRIGILALNSDRYLEYFFAMARGGASACTPSFDRNPAPRRRLRL